MLAENELGSMYASGEGVPKDDKKALEWFKKAAEQGYADAEYNLGTRYLFGSATERDFETAAHWFLKAAEQANLSAPDTLGRMSLIATGLPTAEPPPSMRFQLPP